MSTVQPTQETLDTTLARIHKQFTREAWKGWSKVSALHHKLVDCIQTGEDSGRFHRAYELLQGGLRDWLNDLACEAETKFRTLLDVAIARPDWVPDDPAEWARAQINRFLTEEFEQGAEREEKQWVGPAPLVERAELKSKPARHLDWFRRACEGPPKVSLIPGSTGWCEPWCAPRWVRQSERQIVGWMRLTVEETNSIIWLAQSDFKLQLKSVLDQAEETAYISLARRPSHQSKETTDKGRGKGRIPDKKLEARRKIIREIAQLKVDGKAIAGLAYCKELDSREVPTPTQWQHNHECPKRYVEAWKHKDRGLRKKFQQWISDEKSKATSILRAKPISH